MHRIIIGAIAMLVASVSIFGIAEAVRVSERDAWTEKYTAKKVCIHNLHPASGSFKLARAGWNHKTLDKKPKRIKRVRHRYKCPETENTRKHVRKVIKKQRAKYKKARRKAAQDEAALSGLTPYNCGSSGNWAIPCAIVACESGYSWSAYNPSGALGPYQLLGKGAPWPVTSEADKIAHHRIAANLWAGGAGSSHWTQCL